MKKLISRRDVLKMIGAGAAGGMVLSNEKLLSAQEQAKGLKPSPKPKEDVPGKSRKAVLAAGQFQLRGAKENLDKIEQLTQQAAKQGAQLITFPETCVRASTGQGLDPVMERLGDIARKNNIFLMTGLSEKDQKTNQSHNSCVLMNPKGALMANYHKRCLYRSEKKTFTPGTEDVIVDVGFCRLAPVICYDYVFAQYIRRLVDAGAELICHSSAWWMSEVNYQWNYNPYSFRAMGMARALENSVFFLSSNRWDPVDKENPFKKRHIGQSGIIAPWGEVLSELPEGEGVAVATVDFEKTAGWKKAIASYVEDRCLLGF